MELYETEEEQVEALKKWWKENGTSTIIGATMGIAIILAWNYWQDHKKNVAEQASQTYAQLLKALDSDKKDSVEKLAERIHGEFKSTEYAAYTSLLQAKLKAQQGDFEAAKQILKGIASGSNKHLSNIAKIRLVRILLATGEYEQGLQLVNSVDAEAASSYSANYDELVGDLYVALDRLDEARTSYQSALRNGHQSPLLQLKIDDLSPQEKLDTPK